MPPRHSAAFNRIASATPSGFSDTSLFQNLMTVQPSLSRNRVRVCVGRQNSTCWLPSISTTSLRLAAGQVSDVRRDGKLAGELGPIAGEAVAIGVAPDRSHWSEGRALCRFRLFSMRRCIHRNLTETRFAHPPLTPPLAGRGALPHRQQLQRVLDQLLQILDEAGRVPAVDDAVVAATATGSSACGSRARRRPRPASPRPC